MESIMKARWTCEETAIALIFSSWGFDYEVISQLLTNRMAQLHYVGRDRSAEAGMYRSAESVQKKLARVRKENPELQLPLDQHRRTVAKYVQELQVDHSLINNLLDFTEEDIRYILNVSSLRLSWKVF
jgi:hypothetical protein